MSPSLALRPVFFVASRVHVVRDRINQLRGGEPHPVIDEKYKTEALKFWKNYVNSSEDALSGEQFVALRGLVVRILEKGARLVVVDMPLPGWHRGHSVFFGLCHERIRDCFAGLDPEKFRYIDLSASMPDDYFMDSVHPFPAMSYKWAGLLAENIKRNGWAK